MKLNKDRNIGNVLYVVEGERTEFSILSHIFKHIFEYSIVKAKRHDEDYEQYISPKNPNSTVFIVNSKQSNIKYIGEEGADYLDAVYEKLINEYGLDVDNISTFYLFDRDHQSNNNPKLIRDLLNKLKNPIENDNYYRGGELLLSYPGIESYMLSCCKADVYLINDSLDEKVVYCHQLKKFIADEKISDLRKYCGENILNACEEFLKYLIYTNNTFNFDSDLDDFSSKSQKIFELQEENMNTKKFYDFFSMLSLSFLQLGIITLN